MQPLCGSREKLLIWPEFAINSCMFPQGFPAVFVTFYDSVGVLKITTFPHTD